MKKNSNPSKRFKNNSVYYTLLVPLYCIYILYIYTVCILLYNCFRYPPIQELTYSSILYCSELECYSWTFQNRKKSKKKKSLYSPRLQNWTVLKLKKLSKNHDDINLIWFNSWKAILSLSQLSWLSDTAWRKRLIVRNWRPPI
jgi:hypothetical protein